MGGRALARSDWRDAVALVRADRGAAAARCGGARPPRRGGLVPCQPATVRAPCAMLYFEGEKNAEQVVRMAETFPITC